jgi:hypothetical protein
MRETWLTSCLKGPASATSILETLVTGILPERLEFSPTKRVPSAAKQVLKKGNEDLPSAKADSG